MQYKAKKRLKNFVSLAMISIKNPLFLKNILRSFAVYFAINENSSRPIDHYCDRLEQNPREMIDRYRLFETIS